MRGAFLLAFPLAFVSAGCSSGGACLLDSDCADFSMVCVDRQCVPPGARDGGGRDAGPAGDAGRDGGAVADAGADAGSGDGGVASDGALPACPDLTGAWRAMPLDPSTCGGSSEIPVTLTAGTAVCEFVVSEPLAGTLTVAPDGAVSGTLQAVECTGSVGESFTVTCGPCQFTLVR
jgi:hypothetical protein